MNVNEWRVKSASCDDIPMGYPVPKNIAMDSSLFQERFGVQFLDMDAAVREMLTRVRVSAFLRSN